MPTELTPEQIVALAPDNGVAQSGRSLAHSGKWQRLGGHDIAVWGECQGSGKEAYRVQIDMRTPAFRCTCPSRKFPCKHGIALLLLLANQPARFPQTDPPSWVSEWIAKRAQSDQRTSAPAPSDAEPALQKRAAGQAKRAATREASVAAGLNELTQWLYDLVRQGLATAQSRGPGMWDAMAARMVDAQAPGVARLLRDMAGIPASGAGWQQRLLEQLALLHLLIEGYKQREQLPPALLAEVRTRIGWAQDQERVRTGPGVRDHWLVLDHSVEEEDQLRMQRIWLWSLEAQRPAMLLNFATPGVPLDHSVATGTVIDMEIVYFDGACPLRALITRQHATLGTPPAPFGFTIIDDAMRSYTGALAHNPWLERFPLPLQAVTPLCEGERWYLRDGAGAVLPLIVRGAQGWRLMAISGGHPIALFGTWDGAALMPLSVWADGQLVGVAP